MELFLKIIGITIIVLSSIGAFMNAMVTQDILSSFSFVLIGAMSGSFFLALGRIIALLRIIAEKQPVIVESKTIYTEKPQADRKAVASGIQENTPESTESFDGRRCKKCGAPLADSYTSNICTSCQYGAPRKANSDRSTF